MQQTPAVDREVFDEPQPRPRVRHKSPSEVSTEQSGSTRDATTEENEDEDDYLFVGAQTVHDVSKMLRPNDFRLYYQLPSPSEATVPFEIPLYLSYMSAAKKVYHFPVVCTKDKETGKEEWRVVYGDPRPITFATLSALVKYHKIYSYMDPETGAVDTFPVWKGTVIDLDMSD
ncbi:unnamed protein product [Gongylonema pulchrum]|uniref:Expressed conserved protein n=1 Tax=Gongylonema pulchrum TaxID=637853 RepID=A0A183E8U7_9BILA|nr:unnamed protein product [Gongylonema pulchrum]